MRKRTAAFLFLLLFVLVCIIFACAFILVIKNDEAEESQDDIEIVVNTMEEARKDFTGEFITAKIPESWEIIEYNDEKGMDSKVGDTTYSGVTGFIILNNDKQEVFSFKGIDGIGGTSGCDPIYSFDDTSDEYIAERKKEFDDFINPPQPKIVSLGNNFIQFTLFGREVRRIGTELYWNNDKTNINFNPECGISAAVISFENPNYTVQAEWGESTVGIYVVKIKVDITEQDLKKLDEVFKTISLK